MNALINRDIIASRINSEEGISFTEFSYSLIQAADFETLNTRYNCILQIGGSDQWGNIINGCELVRKKHNREVYGITMPLLLDKSGNKFGKS